MSENARELAALVHDLAVDHRESVDGSLPALWQQIQQLGLVTIGIPEHAGGSGGHLGDLLVVIRELNRAGIGTPLVEASTAALAVGVPRPGAFDTVVTVDGWSPSRSPVNAELSMVAFGGLADRLVVIGEAAVAPVELAQPGVEIEALVDLTGLPAARVRMSQANCGPAVKAYPSSIAERLILARAAAILGAGHGAYELTRSYVAQREQFGAPLINLPAVATALARMAVAIGSAQAALDRAVAVCGDAATSPLRRFGAVTGARVTAAAMATLVARTAHQLHGAVGVTAEYGLHRYTRKLWGWRDADKPERPASAELGANARAADEAVLWEQLLA